MLTTFEKKRFPEIKSSFLESIRQLLYKIDLIDSKLAETITLSHN